MKKILILFFILLAPFLAVAANNDANDTESVEKLNSLLRGELSAVETYRQALEKVSNEPGVAQLKKYHADHQSAVEKLKAEVVRLGGTPSTDSGAWGTWAQTVQGTAKIFGDDAALQALKAGEQHGLDEYEEALEDDDIAASVKTMIRDTFIKQQQEHIKGLDQLMAKR